MARICEICGKGTTIGYNVSHAHNRTKRKVYPNIQRVKVIMDGSVKKINVCTRCIRSGNIVKA